VPSNGTSMVSGMFRQLNNKQKGCSMNQRSNLLLIPALVFCMTLISYSVYIPDTSAQGNLATVHQPFADFTLPSLDGGDVSIADYKGEKNVVLVTFRGWMGFW